MRPRFHLADLSVTIPSEKGTAHAYAAITGRINDQTNQFGQGFRINLVKVGGRWLIEELNTVERLQ